MYIPTRDVIDNVIYAIIYNTTTYGYANFDNYDVIDNVRYAIIYNTTT